MPWAELCTAVQEVVRGASSVDQDELITFVARMYGWSRTGAQIAAGIGTAISYLLDAGVLARLESGDLATNGQ